MLDYFVEFIGTFIFLSVIIITGNPLAIGLTLSAMAWFGSKVSGANYNPAVNLMMFLNKKQNLEKLVGYSITQLLAAACAFFFYKSIK